MLHFWGTRPGIDCNFLGKMGESVIPIFAVKGLSTVFSSEMDSARRGVTGMKLARFWFAREVPLRRLQGGGLTTPPPTFGSIASRRGGAVRYDGAGVVGGTRAARHSKKKTGSGSPRARQVESGRRDSVLGSSWPNQPVEVFDTIEQISHQTRRSFIYT